MEKGIQVILGFSSARITCRKRGGPEVREQGLLCEELTPKIAPMVVAIHSDGYEMEMLEPAHSRGVIQLAEVLQRLRSEVWERPEYKSQGGDRALSNRWLPTLKIWSKKNAPWLLDSIMQLYPQEPVDGYSLIHGDPALSNLMLRGEYYVITDPMPRLEYRREIPNRREVDQGKLVQSACGWERMLGCESSLWDEPDTLLRMLPEEQRQAATVWGAIHIARVALRAQQKNNTRIQKWATNTSKALVR